LIDITESSACELAVRLHSGAASSVEIVTAFIRRIEAVNLKLNAVVIPLFDEALAAAAAADGRRARGESLGALHGLPITVKEIFELRGTPCSAGIERRKGAIAAADGSQVARLRAAGAIVLGKTNLSQLMIYVEADNPVYGRTCNPWDLDRAPGGSSGGEAAILAAGGSALGLGADIGGSIRNPAHSCGICGLMPTSGRVAHAGEYDPNGREGGVLSQPGPMARSAGDVALMASALCAGSPGFPAWQDPSSISLRGLKIGVYEDDGFFRAAPALRRAVREAASALEARGALIDALRPPDVAQAIELYLAMFTADRLAVQRAALGTSKRDPRVAMLLQAATLPDGLRPLLGGLCRLLGQARTASFLRSLHSSTPAALAELRAARVQYQQRFLKDLDDGGFGAWLCPPFALPAIPHGISAYLTDAISYSMLYNFLGWPAGVVPVTRVRSGEESDRPPSVDIVESTARKAERGSAGLPVGVQVIARPNRDELVLALMMALEGDLKSRDGYPSRPPIQTSLVA
jgi:fatty acid amide hydrolase